MGAAVVRSVIFDANNTVYLILKIVEIYRLWKGRRVLIRYRETCCIQASVEVSVVDVAGSLESTELHQSFRRV
jgi:hypothetical protein